MELSMWIIALIILLAAFFFIVTKPGQLHPPSIHGHGRVEFYSKGMDAGFSLSEINLLWHASRRAELENPPMIFGSVEELDKAINQIAGAKKFSERKGSDPETYMLKKLFDYRKKVEMSRPKYRSGLKSTRDIAVGQRLTIRSDGVGIYSSKVVANDQAYMTITIPIGDPLPAGFSWRQVKLNVYFWRKEDAGYFFQTRLIDKFYDRRNLHFRVYHSDNILRSQKRRSVRAPARISARLYPLKGLEEANQWIESNPGLSCLISDISEDGAALRIGGRGRKNQPFKLQFKIRNEIVIVSGVVKRVQYKPKEDESTLHVEFLPPPENTRMILLSYVFDIDRSRTEGNLKENQDALSVISGITPGDEDDEEPTEVIPEDEDAEDAEEVAELEEVPDDETG
ncbi:MAG: PilZ domain-containing protein [Spirochaetaceae bacterium]|nr:PilZ domain-containing protein [Spirochaetaceae bacterium]